MLDNVKRFHLRNSWLDALISALVVFGAAVIAETSFAATVGVSVAPATVLVYVLGADALLSIAAFGFAIADGTASRRHNTQIMANLVAAVLLVAVLLTILV